jgi:hypothetical protein
MAVRLYRLSSYERCVLRQRQQFWVNGTIPKIGIGQTATIFLASISSGRASGVIEQCGAKVIPAEG